MRTFRWLVLGGIALSAGCAPMGPPPPLMGPGPWGGIGWLILIALGVGIYLLVRKETSSSPRDRDHLVETVNDIHERLKRLEEILEAQGKGKEKKDGKRENLEKDTRVV